ncbi:hypothetical protein MIR68_006323 [Amoeboaphelidium protococcarum]|nr:hypothetical protein MIR68_006323 [Amoeboaphelidium protococcarum]
MNIFGSRKTPQELLRQNQRALTRAIRDLDRERTKLEQQEKKIIADIKKSAAKGQMGACKVMAKDLVRTRNYVQKFYGMRAQLQGVSLKIQTLSSNQSMSDAMKGVTKALKMMNKRINLPQMQKIMMDFERESEMMDMKQEMMGDTIDDALDDDVGEDEEESEAIVQQVLDEIGIGVNQMLPGAVIGSGESSAVGQSGRQAAAVGEGGDDLEARLNNLRKD